MIRNIFVHTWSTGTILYCNYLQNEHKHIAGHTFSTSHIDSEIIVHQQT